MPPVETPAVDLPHARGNRCSLAATLEVEL